MTMTRKCPECGKELKWYRLSDRTISTEGEYICDDCWKKIEIKQLDKKFKSTGEQIEKTDYPDEEESEDVRLIEKEIKRLKMGDGSVTALVILGIIGLFFFIIPGIIFLVWANSISSKRKSKIAELRAQLATLKQSRKESKKSRTKEETPLGILKKRYAEGKISEKEFIKKRKLLEK